MSVCIEWRHGNFQVSDCLAKYSIPYRWYKQNINDKNCLFTFAYRFGRPDFAMFSAVYRILKKLCCYHIIWHVCDTLVWEIADLRCNNLRQVWPVFGYISVLLLWTPRALHATFSERRWRCSRKFRRDIYKSLFTVDSDLRWSKLVYNILVLLLLWSRDSTLVFSSQMSVPVINIEIARLCMFAERIANYIRVIQHLPTIYQHLLCTSSLHELMSLIRLIVGAVTLLNI